MATIIMLAVPYLICIALLIVLAWTQILVPTLSNRPLFPIFNKRIQESTKKVDNALENLEVARLNKTASEINKLAKGK